MADKKYYWLKLHRDFFKRHDIQIIEDMENGKDYILFYLKLLVESIDHDGELRFSDAIPYSDKMLATVTHTNIDIVRSAMKIFEELQMVTVLDDETIFMEEVSKMIGCATDDEQREQWRIRQQRHREKVKRELLRDVSCDCHVTSSLEKEIEIDIEKESEIETDKEIEIDKKSKTSIDYQKIVSMYNEICISFPKVTTLSEKRKKAIKARSNQYSDADFEKLFEKAENSNFLKGGNYRNWNATFDWLINDTNMAKVLDGNYDNKPGRAVGAQQPIDWSKV